MVLTNNHEMPIPVSVILLTFNEEHHLPGVLNNIRGWAEEVLVVDSLSSDRTIDIALEHGAKIVQRPFTNFGDQWNFALDKLPIKTAWTLKLDPDERLTDELKNEIREIIDIGTTFTGFSMLRRLWFMGKPLHVKAPVLRLWRTGKCRFSDVLVNEHPLVDGEVGYLKGLMEHFDSRDLHHWMDKQNRYSTMEAISACQALTTGIKPRLFGRPLERKMFLKTNIGRVPFRFALIFLYNLFVKGAWRDGTVGWAWARLRAEIYRMRELKATEMTMTGRVPDIPVAAHGDFDPRVLETGLQKELMAGMKEHTDGNKH